MHACVGCVWCHGGRGRPKHHVSARPRPRPRPAPCAPSLASPDQVWVTPAVAAHLTGPLAQAVYVKSDK